MPSVHSDMPVELAVRAWPSVPPDALLLLPIGSTEQHGPHLPFTTDAVVATAVAHALAEAVGAPVVVAPVLPFGSSGEHAGFPGTISIGREALSAVLVEAVRSATLWARRVVVVNGHGGNAPVLATAVPLLRAEGRDVAWLPCGVPGGDAHAGRIETSLLLHLAPHAVALDRAAAGDVRPVGQILPDLVARGVRAVSPSGVLGDPRGATAEEGRTLLATIVESARRRLLAADVDGSGCLRDPDPATVGAS